MSIELTRRGLVLSSAVMLAAARFSPAGAAALAPLRFGTSAGINTAIQPCLYAKTSGLYEKYGLNVSFVDMQDDTTAMQALIADACDMLYAGAGTGMIAVTRGAKIKLVSSFTPWTDFVMLAQKDVTDVKQLPGKVIGISKLGALNYQATVYALKQAGVDPSSVQFLATGTDAQRAQALAGGKIAAGTVNGVAAVAALDAKPDLHMLYDVGAAFRASFMSTAVFATDKLINSHPEIVQGAVTAMVQACRDLQASQAAAVKQAVASGLNQHAVEIVYKNLFAASVPYYGVDGGLNQGQVESTMGILKNNGDIDSIPKYTDVVDSRFVTQALKDLGPYKA